MSLKLYEQVSLVIDVPEYQLKRGDVAVLVDRLPHPSGGEAGCILEVFNAIGDSIAVLTVPESAVEPMRADEVMAVRLLVDSH
ncbi:MAG: DUF4926 domain-containing protein [Ardenticatenales bacterium]|jgi:hypothetical protein|nr:DUF4926 domain-containing protein [Ardenticatenales bacterium]